MNTIATTIQKYLIYILFLFLLIISSPAIYDSFYGIISENQYAFNELFINYQFGFIRRGLLGEIFYQFYKQLQIEPKNFFLLYF